MKTIFTKALFNICFLLILVGFAQHARTSFAASFELEGNYRVGGNLFTNLHLDGSKPAGLSDATTYLEHRLLLQPNVIIDDRFEIKSTWYLLHLNRYAGNSAFGSVFGSNNQGGAVTGTTSGTTIDGNIVSPLIDVRHVYAEWKSDYGILRAGRMPKAWGLGLQYDDGLGVLDEFGDVIDSVNFTAQVNNIELRFAYEKEEEGHISQEHDDVQRMEGYVLFTNDEESLDIGLRYGRRVVGNVSQAKANGERSAHETSFYVRKEWDKSIELGLEADYISKDSGSDAFGVLGIARYQTGNFHLGLDALYASDSFEANANYQPLLILFKQPLATKQVLGNNGIRNGGPVGSEILGANQGSGAILGKFNVDYETSSENYRFGLDLGYAQFADKDQNSSAVLGYEVDFRFVTKLYDNFKLGTTAGVFIPGEAFPNDGELAWGLQVLGHVEF